MFLRLKTLIRRLVNRMAAGSRDRSVQTNRESRRNELLAEERAKEALALDLHDGVQQEIVSVGILVETLRQLLGSNADPPPVEKLREITERIAAYLKGIVEEIRQLGQELGTGAGEGRGLMELLDSQTSRFQKLTGIETKLSQETEPAIEQWAKIQVMRIVQEALGNVHRHAGASEVRISLRATARECLVEICDNGIGISQEPIRVAESQGLQNMNTRAEAIGGRVEYGQAEGRGTRVKLVFPQG